MSSYHTFAIAGVGNLGTVIVNELLQEKSSGKVTDIIVLTRSSSKNTKVDEFASKGVTITPVDYNDTSSLSTALSGVDVVISTLSLDALASQEALAVASKAAGVKLFVPSEFGNPTNGPQEGPLAFKVAIQEKLKEINLPYTRIFNGPLMEICLTPYMGIDLKNGKGIAGGDGNIPISWTAVPDMARFLAHVLTALPPSELEWRTFSIEGERASMNEIYKSYEAKTGTRVEITYRSIPELQEAFKANPHDFASLLHLLWALGMGTVGKPEQVSNGAWPEWNAKKILDVVGV